MATDQGRLLTRIADAYGVDPHKMLTTLKQTAFRSAQQISNEEMMAVLVVAEQYGLNPFTGEIHAFPSGRGVIPVVGVDGWARIINDHPQFDGLEFEQAPDEVRLDDFMQPAPEWMECIIYRKDRSHPVKVREYLDEVYVPPKQGRKGPWQTHTKRMLRHKTMIQCARIAFSFSGIYDQDEAERIQQAEPIDVTPPDENPASQESRSEAIKEQLRGSRYAPEPDPETGEDFPLDMEQDDGEQGDSNGELGEGPGGEADEQQQTGDEPDTSDDETVQGQ